MRVGAAGLITRCLPCCGTLPRMVRRASSLCPVAILALRAGCVRAMELDINPAWTTFNFYNAKSPGDPASVKGTKLLPEAEKSGNRYLSNDARDFVAVYARKK